MPVAPLLILVMGFIVKWYGESLYIYISIYIYAIYQDITNIIWYITNIMWYIIMYYIWLMYIYMYIYIGIIPVYCILNVGNWSDVSIPKIKQNRPWGRSWKTGFHSNIVIRSAYVRWGLYNWWLSWWSGIACLCIYIYIIAAVKINCLRLAQKCKLSLLGGSLSLSSVLFKPTMNNANMQGNWLHRFRSKLPGMD